MGRRQWIHTWHLRKVNGCKQPPKEGDRVVFINTPEARSGCTSTFNPGDTPGFIEVCQGDNLATVCFDEDVGG